MNTWTPNGVIGMVHLAALPGTPGTNASPSEITNRAVRDAKTLAGAGFDAILIENMHDLPYLRRDVGSEVVAAMTHAIAAIRRAVAVPLGVQVLAGANRAAMSIAHATGCAFIRAEGYAYASVADEGLLDGADAGPLLRHRKAIGAEAVAVWADVHKKHSAHSLTADLSLKELVAGFEFCGADAIVVTGATTGDAVKMSDLAETKGATTLPVIVGSGATAENVATLLGLADAVVVGSSIKANGDWRGDVDSERARVFVEAARRAT